MKRILAFVLVVFAAGGAIAGQAPSRAADDKAALIQLVTDFKEAVRTRDTSKIESLLASDFSFTHSNGTVSDKVRELSDIRSTDSRWTSVDIADVHVRLYGDVGIVTGSQTFHGTGKGFKEGRRLSTHIFVKRDGRWQCVGGQFTLAPTKSPT